MTHTKNPSPVYYTIFALFTFQYCSPKAPSYNIEWWKRIYAWKRFNLNATVYYRSLNCYNYFLNLFIVIRNSKKLGNYADNSCVIFFILICWKLLLRHIFWQLQEVFQWTLVSSSLRSKQAPWQQKNRSCRFLLNSNSLWTFLALLIFFLKKKLSFRCTTTL